MERAGSTDNERPGDQSVAAETASSAASVPISADTYGGLLALGSLLPGLPKDSDRPSDEAALPPDAIERWHDATQDPAPLGD
jgi:hypothetical protein